MRERVWFRLRSSQYLRKLFCLPILTRPMGLLSNLLVPSTSKQQLRVQNGPAKGLILELNPRWETGLWRGFHEMAIQERLAEGLNTASVFYDVGAGFGFFSLLAARLGARVFAFEPDGENARSLRRHVKLNSFESKIEVFEFVVGRRSGTEQITVAPQDRGHGNSQLVRATGSTVGPFQTVPCVTLDAFARTHATPSVIKIDVEGAESEVMDGADELLMGSHPTVICEVHNAENALRVRESLVRRRYVIEYQADGAQYPFHLIATPTMRTFNGEKTHGSRSAV